jgi:hypothetical protein
MATDVRIFSYTDVLSVRIGNANLAQSNEGLLLLREPYLAREKLAADTGAAVASSAATAPAGTKMLRIEVAPGARIRYRVTPEGNTLVDADADDPVLEGTRTIAFYPGARLSVLQVS